MKNKGTLISLHFVISAHKASAWDGQRLEDTGGRMNPEPKTEHGPFPQTILALLRIDSSSGRVFLTETC